MVKPRRKKISWTVEEAARRAAPKLYRMPYIEEEDSSTEEDREHLEVGSLWYLTTELARDDSYSPSSYEQHPYPYISEHANAAPFAKRTSQRRIRVSSFKNVGARGTPAIYLGTVRVEEQDPRTSRLLAIPRHSFMVDGIRYITRTLDFFTWNWPIESPSQ